MFELLKTTYMIPLHIGAGFIEKIQRLLKLRLTRNVHYSSTAYSRIHLPISFTAAKEEVKLWDKLASGTLTVILEEIQSRNAGISL
jgi:hypothetical protein